MKNKESDISIKVLYIVGFTDYTNAKMPKVKELKEVLEDYQIKRVAV
jgi:hypothetical protein